MQQRRIYFHCDSGCKYCNSRLPIGCHGLVRRSFVENPISILQLRLQTTERHKNYKVKSGSDNHFQRPSCAAKSICGLNKARSRIAPIEFSKSAAAHECAFGPKADALVGDSHGSFRGQSRGMVVAAQAGTKYFIFVWGHSLLRGRLRMGRRPRFYFGICCVVRRQFPGGAKA